MLSIIRNGVQVAVISAVFIASGLSTVDWQIGSTPVDVRHGWAGVDAVDLSAEFIAEQPLFEIVDADGNPVRRDNSKANVRLWELQQLAAGMYPLNVPQEIGDCTSWGTKHASEATEGSQIAGGKPQTWRPIFAPFTYGAARVWVLKGRIRGDGATGASVAEASKIYGLLPADLPGLPSYSGAIAKEWGRVGPPAKWKDEAAKYRMRTTSRVTNAIEIRDAVVNGYGVIICSDWGAEGRSAFTQRDGRWVASRRGSWSHCMCVDGYDGSASQPYWHVTNSWGPTAHPAPIDDSPPGGFWIAERDMQYIAVQGDSWALSEFDGFPLQALPDLFGRSKRMQPVRASAGRVVVSQTRKTTVSP